MSKNRMVSFNFSNGDSKSIKVGKVVKAKGKRNVMYFDKVGADVWRIIVSEDLMEDIALLESMEFDID